MRNLKEISVFAAQGGKEATPLSRIAALNGVEED